MQILQTKKRIHRIGQEHPVTVVHLIAKGSVDHAINCVHADKMTLARAVVDDEIASLAEGGGRWRTTGRIVDNCKFMNDDGTFPDDDLTEQKVDMQLARARANMSGFETTCAFLSARIGAASGGVLSAQSMQF